MEPQQQHFRMFAGYNAWANERLYASVATLPVEAFEADHGAFFRSLRGTLNHLLVTDEKADSSTVPGNGLVERARAAPIAVLNEPALAAQRQRVSAAPARSRTCRPARPG
jgi:hypothetical protein